MVRYICAFCTIFLPLDPCPVQQWKDLRGMLCYKDEHHALKAREENTNPDSFSPKSSCLSHASWLNKAMKELGVDTFMDRLTVFGLFAVTAMMICYALENRSRWFIPRIRRRLRPGFHLWFFFRAHGLSDWSRLCGRSSRSSDGGTYRINKFMLKLILILLVGMLFESTGVILLKKGITHIGEMNGVTAAEVFRVTKAGLTNPQILLGIFFEALFFLLPHHSHGQKRSISFLCAAHGVKLRFCDVRRDDFFGRDRFGGALVWRGFDCHRRGVYQLQRACEGISRASGQPVGFRQPISKNPISTACFWLFSDVFSCPKHESSCPEMAWKYASKKGSLAVLIHKCLEC